ncbi:MAG TPA: EamA family transporter [Ktedonobacterales bacterium]
MSATPVLPAAPAAKRAIDPRVGYYFAAANAIISGFAIYINSLGVKMFHSSTLYTTMKNSVVGLALLLPFFFLAANRAEIRRLTARQWGLLALIALTGGSVAYALNFRGLQLSNAVMGSLTDHTQFLLVAVLAAIFLRERFGVWVWVALLVLFVGLSLGISVSQVRWSAGVPLLIAAALLFAIDFVIIKYTLGDVSTWTVMLFKMGGGALILIGLVLGGSLYPRFGAYVAAKGAARELATLNATQWGFVIVTGLILLAFTITSILGLRHASATGVTAISAASPIITTILVVLAQHAPVAPARLLGLGLILAAAVVIFTLAQRKELRLWRQRSAASASA